MNQNSTSKILSTCLRNHRRGFGLLSVNRIEPNFITELISHIWFLQNPKQCEISEESLQKKKSRKEMEMLCKPASVSSSASVAVQAAKLCQISGLLTRDSRRRSDSSRASISFGKPIGLNERKAICRKMCCAASTTSSTVTASSDDLFNGYKPSLAFLFPGQGAQTVGMGKDSQSVPAAADLFAKANAILGYDLLDVCVNGPKEKLDSTVISQPAIYVTSLAAVESLRARDGGQNIIDSVDVTCGLSLGEYTALAFAGAFSFEDGLKLVKLRGEAMQEASDAAKSAMVSVIGLDSEKVQLLCDAANEEVDEKERVQIANYLCPGNYAVSGGVKGIEAVESKAKSFKARMTVRLAVAGAFHTHFMQPAVSQLEAALKETQIRTPRIPVVSNVDARPHSDPATIRDILARQVTSPVQWETTLKTLLQGGLKQSYELGPGKVISGIIKRINKAAAVENVGA